MTVATEPETYPFSIQAFRTSFDTVRPLLLAEWPELDAAALDLTDADPDRIVALVTEKTQSSKALVRKHLAEIAEVAGVDARGLEGRVLRLIHALEGKLEPVQETLGRHQETAKAALAELESRSKHVVADVKKAGADVEDTLKGNIWRSLFGALGIGVLIGLVIGLTRGR